MKRIAILIFTLLTACTVFGQAWLDKVNALKSKSDSADQAKSQPTEKQPLRITSDDVVIGFSKSEFNEWVQEHEDYYSWSGTSAKLKRGSYLFLPKFYFEKDTCVGQWMRAHTTPETQEVINMLNDAFGEEYAMSDTSLYIFKKGMNRDVLRKTYKWLYNNVDIYLEVDEWVVSVIDSPIERTATDYNMVFLSQGKSFTSGTIWDQE